MSEVVIIYREAAEADGVNVEKMLAFQRARRPETIFEVRAKNAPKTKLCVGCDTRFPIQAFPLGVTKSGRTTRRSNRCAPCQVLFVAAGKPRASRARVRTCESCQETKPVEEFANHKAQTVARASLNCRDCRRDLNKPPYGWKVCPRCEERTHHQEFRTDLDGSKHPGRPFVTCHTCRA